MADTDQPDSNIHPFASECYFLECTYNDLNRTIFDAKNARSIQCDLCDQWVHKRCAAEFDSEYRLHFYEYELTTKKKRACPFWRCKDCAQLWHEMKTGAMDISNAHLSEIDDAVTKLTTLIGKQKDEIGGLHDLLSQQRAQHEEDLISLRSQTNEAIEELRDMILQQRAHYEEQLLSQRTLTSNSIKSLKQHIEKQNEEIAYLRRNPEQLHLPHPSQDIIKPTATTPLSAALVAALWTAW